MHECGAKTKIGGKCKRIVSDDKKWCRLHQRGSSRTKSSSGSKSSSFSGFTSRTSSSSSSSKKSSDSSVTSKVLKQSESFNSEWPPYPNFWEYYEIVGEPLGKGTFGLVIKIKSKMDEKPYALKILFKTERIDMREIAALIALSHTPNCRRGIACYYRKIRVPSSVIKNSINLGDINLPEYAHVIIMEYVNGPSLDRTVGVYTEDDLYHLLRDALETLEYIHKRRIAHRDIKPANLMVEEFYSEKGKASRIVFIDFGLATYFKNDDVAATSIAGTPNYLSPEIIADVPATKRFSLYEKGDIFALGITFYVLMARKRPSWVAKDGRKYLFDVEKFTNVFEEFNPPQGSSKNVKKLYKAIKLMVRINGRPSAREVLREL